jgi:SAM-dependent methyltransferase
MSQQMDWTGYGGSAAEIYKRHMVPAIFGPWAEDLVACAAPQPGERVLDVACGTGVVARLVAQRVGPAGQVVGLDLNPGMLTVARALPPSQGAMIAWREGNASAIPLADAAFDLVLCQQGLQFFPDRPAALRRGGYEAYARPPALPDSGRRAVWAILVCRTALLGGHVPAWPDGPVERIWYNSCRHRLCPPCAWGQMEHWLARQ